MGYAETVTYLTLPPLHAMLAWEAYFWRVHFLSLYRYCLIYVAVELAVSKKRQLQTYPSKTAHD